MSEGLYKPPPGENTASRINSALNYLYIFGVIFSPLSCKICEWFFTESWECLSLAVKEKQLRCVVGQVAGWRLRDVPKGAAARLAGLCAVRTYCLQFRTGASNPSKWCLKGLVGFVIHLGAKWLEGQPQGLPPPEDSASFSLMQRFQPKILLWEEKKILLYKTKFGNCWLGWSLRLGSGLPLLLSTGVPLSQRFWSWMGCQGFYRCPGDCDWRPGLRTTASDTSLIQGACTKHLW